MSDLRRVMFGMDPNTVHLFGVCLEGSFESGTVSNLICNLFGRSHLCGNWIIESSWMICSFDLKEFNRNCPKPKIKVYPELVVSMCLLFSTFLFLCDFLESQYNMTALRQKWDVLYTQGRGHAWSYVAHRHGPREAQRRSTQLKALCEQLVQCVGGKTCCMSNNLWHCDIVTFIDRFEHRWDIFAAACLCSTVKLETSHDRGSAWRLCKAFAPQQFALASAKTIACAFQTLETHFHLG